jgi:hypothetical protein
MIDALTGVGADVAFDVASRINNSDVGQDPLVNDSKSTGVMRDIENIRERPIGHWPWSLRSHSCSARQGRGCMAIITANRTETETVLSKHLSPGCSRLALIETRDRLLK